MENVSELDLGYRILQQLEGEIFGLYFFEYGRGTRVLVHAGTKLYYWHNYPDEGFTELYNDMNEEKSTFFVYTSSEAVNPGEPILYICDGKNYLYYDGNIVDHVRNIAYIPTSTIARSPAGGGADYQGINVLQPKRKNQFVGDGTSTVYVLDAVNLDSDAVRAWVNDVLKVEGTDFTVNRTLGKVTFNVAPPKSTLSNDNVVIEFAKKITGYEERIEECTKALVFDNRVFFSGNQTYNNALFHCKLDNPTYISDLDYYQDGMDDAAIKAMIVGNNVLWILKEDNQQNHTIYYHTPTLDTENGRIYPSAQGNVSVGCVSEGINFKDDIVFLTKGGLQGISSSSIASRQILSHRSTLIDNKMINQENYDKASMIEWKDYLIILVNGKIFLADSRQVFRGNSGNEYEWYYWEFVSESKIKLIKEYQGNLFLRF